MKRRGQSRSLVKSTLGHLDLQYGERVWRLPIHSMKGSVRISFLYTVSYQLFCFVVQDFEPIPHLIHHALNKVMGCPPGDHPILVTEPSWNSQANRERMAEIMFEKFNVPAFYIANTGVLNAFVTNSSFLANNFDSFFSAALQLVKDLL